MAGADELSDIVDGVDPSIYIASQFEPKIGANEMDIAGGLRNKAIDVVSFSHRGFGGHLVWSGHPCDHLNQYFANAGSPTKAREGNIHHGDPAHRSIPMISHLGVMLPTGHVAPT